MALEPGPASPLFTLRSLRARGLGAAALTVALAAGCTPQTGDSTGGEPGTGTTTGGPTTGDADPTTSDATSTVDPTTGAPTTTGDTTTDTSGDGTTGEPCEPPPVPDALAWEAPLPNFPFDLATGLDGDAIWLTQQQVARIGAGGTQWTWMPGEKQYPGVLASAPDGRVIVGGSSPGPTWTLWSLSPDGELLVERTAAMSRDHYEEGMSVAITPTGDVFVAVWVQDIYPELGRRVRIDRFDAALEHVWSADAGECESGELAIAADAAGGAYLATVDDWYDDSTTFWTLNVHGFDPQGAPLWSRDDVEFKTIDPDHIIDVEISVGDQVYAIASNSAGYGLQAVALDGTPAWLKTFGSDFKPTEDILFDHRMRSVVAAPCSGVFVGGRSTLEPNGLEKAASVLHIAADGSFGKIHRMPETHEPFGHGEATLIAVSPEGRIFAAGDLSPLDFEIEEPGWLHGY